MSKFFAIAFTTIGVLAFIGAAFYGAGWHYGTAVMCFVLGILFHAENQDHQTPGLSGN